VNLIRLPRILLAIAATPAFAASQGPAAVRDYHPGVNAEHYAFHVVIPDTGRRVSVTTVAYIRRSRAVDTLRLDLHSAMRVSRVTVNAREATFARDSTSVRIALPRWNRAECENPRPSTVDRPDPCLDWVSVDAAGVPANGLIISQDGRGRWLYFADHGPTRARFGLPVIDHPSDKATVEWRVHAPATSRVIANGRVREDRNPLPNEPGRAITAWRSDIPIPTYLMVIGVAPMARIDLGATACGFAELGGCVDQDVYEAPELAPRIPPGFAAAGRIVEWLSRTVGPFPYEKLSHVQSSTQFGGMENASAIFYSDAAFRNMTLGEGLVAHETAHQWFGNAVTAARWADLWLSEGFATYFAALWEREARGDSAFRAAMAGIKQRIVNAPVVRDRPVVDSMQTDLMALLNANSYQKGGFVLHMLRRQIGDSAFARGIRAYYAAHKHGNATSADLQRAMERFATGSLGWFFQQWLTRPGFAELSVAWDHAADGSVTVRIVQSSRFGAYRLSLPVVVERADGSVGRHVLDVPANAQASVVLPVRYSVKPRALRFDPDGDLLATITQR
jgi:aminopeptidase N